MFICLNPLELLQKFDGKTRAEVLCRTLGRQFGSLLHKLSNHHSSFWIGSEGWRTNCRTFHRLEPYSPYIDRQRSHHIYLLHINSSGPYIGGDQNPGGPSPEFRHDGVSFLLWHVAMHAADSEIILPHLLSQPVNLLHAKWNSAFVIFLQSVCAPLKILWPSVDAICASG